MNLINNIKLTLVSLSVPVAVAATVPASDVPRDAGCGIDLETSPRLFSWDDLPDYRRVELPPDFLFALAKNRAARSAAVRYDWGRSLSFDFSRIQREANGWGIQGQFLRTVVSALFPHAIFDRGAVAGRAKVKVTLYDSVLTRPRLDTDVDILALKSANPGPVLPAMHRLRELLGLPIGAKIISLYASWTHVAVAVEYATRLLREGFADLVIYSYQGPGQVAPWELTALAAQGIEFMDCEMWADRPRPPEGRVMVFNSSRGRMPYVHAASDQVVVLGMANGAEGLRAGRPTFMTESTVKPAQQRRWTKMLNELKRTGGLSTFNTCDDLIERLRAGAHGAPTSALYQDPKVIGRLVREILRVVDQAAAAARP